MPTKSEQFARIRLIPTLPTINIPCSPSPSASARNSLANSSISCSLALTTAICSPQCGSHYTICGRYARVRPTLTQISKSNKTGSLFSSMYVYWLSSIRLITAHNHPDLSSMPTRAGPFSLLFFLVYSNRVMSSLGPSTLSRNSRSAPARCGKFIVK